MKYRFREGASVPGISAEDAAGEFDRLYTKHGKITSGILVDESRPKSSLFHGGFEWNDKKAAHEHRLSQARNIIRCVVVVDEEKNESAPLYVHVRTSDETRDPKSREGEYHPATVVVANVDMFEMALSELESKVSAAVRAVEGLKRAAEKSEDPDRLAKVALAVRALEAASSAIHSLH